tara:strand:+ start:48 stop:371 length:324 start_codon:yes stop_codon:yes gene_type:complete
MAIEQLLLESGDALLLESGDAALIESSGAAAEEEVTGEADLTAGPSGEDDVLTEVISVQSRGGGNRVTVYSGGINFTSAGTKLAPAAQASINKLDNRFTQAVAVRYG